MSDRLDHLVNEAKQDLEPRVSDQSWAAMEARLVQRMSAERAALVDEVNVVSLPARRARLFQLGAAALAVAASVAFFVGKDPGASLADAQAIAADTQAGTEVEMGAGSLRGTEGNGEVRVGGVAATAGHVLRAGDVVEAQGARALLERPRKVSWLLEGEASASVPARARVKSAGESLVLGLEDGAIEAQVTPVPSGEAFAVDIASGTSLVRVAVHGTHLRVARNGSHVTVDLTEGIVSIGRPPRTGSTYGTLVTAPSHVEFDAANLDATLIVSHVKSAVRVAIPLAPQEPVAMRGDPPTPEHPVALPKNDVAPDATGANGIAMAGATVPRPAGVAAPPSRSPTKPSAKGAEPVSARDTIARAVRDCVAARHPRTDVRVTVTSTLRLKVTSNGDVETAQFDPPLAPEIQSCATTAIYKAKLDEAAFGNVTIPIDFSY